MKGPFEIIRIDKGDGKEKPGIGIGVKIKIGEHETLCPISGICESVEAIEAEASLLKENIENILSISKSILHGTSPPVVEIRSDMEPEEIWKILSSIQDETTFSERFNHMEVGKRKEVADYVLTRCNIFAGKGAVFSSRYDSESGLLM